MVYENRAINSLSLSFYNAKKIPSNPTLLLSLKKTPAKKLGMKTQTIFVTEFEVEIYCACLTLQQKLLSPVGQTKFISRMKLGNRHKLVLKLLWAHVKRANIWH
jgi:hypothetical protein